jgi:hypothetical protein
MYTIGLVYCTRIHESLRLKLLLFGIVNMLSLLTTTAITTTTTTTTTTTVPVSLSLRPTSLLFCWKLLPKYRPNQCKLF